MPPTALVKVVAPEEFIVRPWESAVDASTVLKNVTLPKPELTTAFDCKTTASRNWVVPVVLMSAFRLMVSPFACRSRVLAVMAKLTLMLSPPPELLRSESSTTAPPLIVASTLSVVSAFIVIEPPLVLIELLMSINPPELNSRSRGLEVAVMVLLMMVM